MSRDGARAWHGEPSRRHVARHSARTLGAVLALAVLSFGASAAAATVEHTVARGHTLGAIARRYHTTVAAIEKANRLEPGKKIYPGQTLRIQVPDPKRERRAESRRASRSSRRPAPKKRATIGRSTRAKHPPPTPDRGGAFAIPRRPRSSSADHPYARKPVRPGHVTLMRYSERFSGQLVDEQRQVRPAAHRRVSRLLRDLKSRMQIYLHPRLLQVLAEISDHFGSRTMVVVSGFRLYSTKQHAERSRHNHGRAIDFRIVGVPNEVLRDYCLSLPKVGVGYYPNSTFVHLDVREHRSAWIDYSRPGERPRYARKSKGKGKGRGRRSQGRRGAAGARGDARRPAERTAGPGARPPAAASRGADRAATGSSRPSANREAKPARQAKPARK